MTGSLLLEDVEVEVLPSPDLGYQWSCWTHRHHPDNPAFAGVELLRRNFTAKGNSDAEGHDTHCAGTIFYQNIKRLLFKIIRNVKRVLLGKVNLLTDELEAQFVKEAAACLDGLKGHCDVGGDTAECRR